jgi:hypothetical protein
MGNNISEQFYADEDGCIYFYNYTKKHWQKICDIVPSELPRSVIERLEKAKERAEELSKLPR